MNSRKRQHHVQLPDPKGAGIVSENETGGDVIGGRLVDPRSGALTEHEGNVVVLKPI
jgi:hypothetical protein